jgi:hypothetical protein
MYVLHMVISSHNSYHNLEIICHLTATRKIAMKKKLSLLFYFSKDIHKRQAQRYNSRIFVKKKLMLTR